MSTPCIHLLALATLFSGLLALTSCNQKNDQIWEEDLLTQRLKREIQTLTISLDSLEKQVNQPDTNDSLKAIHDRRLLELDSLQQTLLKAKIKILTTTLAKEEIKPDADTEWREELGKTLKQKLDSLQQLHLMREIRVLSNSLEVPKSSPSTDTVFLSEQIHLINQLEQKLDSLQNINQKQSSSTGINDFRNEFTKVWDGLIETLDLKRISVILSLILTAFLLSFLLRRYVQRKAAESTRRRLPILRWLPIINLFIWMVIAILPTLYTIMSHPNIMWPFLAAIALIAGIAAKDGITDLLGGLWLIFEAPFQIGDRIQVGEHYGEVKGIKVRSTQIDTLDDNRVTIPNSKILGESIANANAGQSACLVVVSMLLPIDIEVEKIKRIAYEAAITSPYVKYNEPITTLFSDHFGDPPGTKLTIKAYVFDARFEKALASDIAEAAKQAFVEAGVYR